MSVAPFYFLNLVWTSKARNNQPHIERSLLIGSQGSRARAHAVVHHLLPQVMDFGLKTPVLCKTRLERIKPDRQVCIHTAVHPGKENAKEELKGTAIKWKQFNLFLAYSCNSKSKGWWQRQEACLRKSCTQNVILYIVFIVSTRCTFQLFTYINTYRATILNVHLKILCSTVRT